MSGYNEDYCSKHTVSPTECGCPICAVEELRAHISDLREALEAVVRDHEWLANIADLQNMPRPEWYNKAQAALKLVRGT